MNDLKGRKQIYIRLFLSGIYSFLSIWQSQVCPVKINPATSIPQCRMVHHTFILGNVCYIHNVGLPVSFFISGFYVFLQLSPVAGH